MATADPNNPNFTFRRGLVGNDVPYSYRASGVYELPWAISLSGTFQYYQGFPELTTVSVGNNTVALTQRRHHGHRGTAWNHTPAAREVARTSASARMCRLVGSSSNHASTSFNLTNQATILGRVTQLGPTYGREQHPARTPHQGWVQSRVPAKAGRPGGPGGSGESEGPGRPGGPGGSGPRRNRQRVRRVGSQERSARSESGDVRLEQGGACRGRPWSGGARQRGRSGRGEQSGPRSLFQARVAWQGAALSRRSPPIVIGRPGRENVRGPPGLPGLLCALSPHVLVEPLNRAAPRFVGRRLVGNVRALRRC